MAAINEDDSNTTGFYESDADSDRELQIALQKGWLKPGLNVPYQRVKARVPINNVAGLKSKLQELDKSNRFDWLERLDVTVARRLAGEDGLKATAAGESSRELLREDDFKRELTFYQQAQGSVLEALPMLHRLNVPTMRPGDYLAEMAKSDQQMAKVRQHILSEQQAKERSNKAKKLREERKFAVKVQREVLQQRQKDKRKLVEAVKKHKKGFTEQLEDALRDVRTGGPTAFDRDDKPNKDHMMKKKKFSKKQAFKSNKYGFGGQKKRGKYNTAESAASMDGFRGSSQKQSKVKAKMPHRPGKSRRREMKNRKKH